MIRLRYKNCRWLSINQHYQSETWQLIKVPRIVTANRDIMFFLSLSQLPQDSMLQAISRLPGTTTKEGNKLQVSQDSKAQAILWH